MKEISIIIKPEKIEQIKEIADKHHCGGMTISTVMGCGTQLGYADGGSVVKGMHTSINLLPKIRVDVVVKNAAVNEIILDICDKIPTGNMGDGKIFVRDIEDAIRIRTGERGEGVL